MQLKNIEEFVQMPKYFARLPKMVGGGGVKRLVFGHFLTLRIFIRKTKPLSFQFFCFILTLDIFGVNFEKFESQDHFGIQHLRCSKTRFFQK
jgi:hypothetical protein